MNFYNVLYLGQDALLYRPGKPVMACSSIDPLLDDWLAPLAKDRKSLLIVLDSFDLDFRVESLPNLGHHDLRKTLDRKKQGIFRRTVMTGHYCIGEDAQQPMRKRWALHGLSGIKPLQDMLQRLTAYGIAIAGVVNAPLTLAQWIAAQGYPADQEPASIELHLFMTRPNTCRFLLMQNGQLVFTRVATNLPEDADAQNDALHSEIARVRSYALSQKMATVNRPLLSIYRYLPVGAIVPAAESDATDIHIRRFHPAKDQPDDLPALPLFMMHWLAGRYRVKHDYTTITDRLLHIARRVRLAIYGTAASVLVVFAVLLQTWAGETEQAARRFQQWTQKNAELNLSLQTLLAQQGLTDADATTLTDQISFYQQMRSMENRHWDVFQRLSRILDRAPQFTLAALSWTTDDDYKMPGATPVAASPGPSATQSAINAATGVPAPLVSRQRIYFEANLQTQPTMRESYNQVLALLNDLKNNGGRIDVVQWPLDFRNDQSVQSTIRKIKTDTSADDAVPEPPKALAVEWTWTH
ncbi:MAG: hypothetical protein ACK5NY_02855 [Burkholderiaceae bacterium]|jgi:hypothetical protein